jgi:hypothetical protein
MNYGKVLIDMEISRPIDLLSARESATSNVSFPERWPFKNKFKNSPGNPPGFPTTSVNQWKIEMVQTS